MSQRLLNILGNLFMVFGCLLLLTLAVSLGHDLSDNSFSWLHVKLLGASIGDACFALLMGVVFRMISAKKPWCVQGGRWLARLSAAGYAAHGILGAVGSLHIIASNPAAPGEPIFVSAQMALGLAQNIVPVIMAISIVTIYEYFSQLQIFESEVA